MSGEQLGRWITAYSPTEERVQWILRGAPTGMEASLGKIMPRGGIADIGTIASALAMAGGRPEYLPVLCAAMDALLDPKIAHDKAQATSGSTFPVVIVNGPIAKDIGLNSGFGLLGPDPQHPAGASIGRALRLLLQNVGGALPGVGSMALFGAMRTTNACLLKMSPTCPRAGCPSASNTAGMQVGQNAVTVYMATGASNVMRRGVGKETAPGGGRRPHPGGSSSRCTQRPLPRSWSPGIPGTLLLPPVVAGQLAGQGYNSKAEVREKLWSLSKIAAEVVRESGMIQWIEQDDDPAARASASLDLGPSPSHLISWYSQSQAATIRRTPSGCRLGPSYASRGVSMPEDWDRLIAEAESEIGPSGEFCVIG